MFTEEDYEVLEAKDYGDLIRLVIDYGVHGRSDYEYVKTREERNGELLTQGDVIEYFQPEINNKISSINGLV